MKTLAERIKLALDEAGESQKSLAAACAVSQPSVNDWLSGKTQSLKATSARRAAEFLGVSILWLTEGRGPMRDAPKGGNVIALHPGDKLPDGVIQIPVYKVLFSAGNGHTVSYEQVEEAEPVTYRISFFQRLGINPEKTKRFKVDGDSMEPFLYSGDSVLVNLAENSPEMILDGKVYAIRYGDDLRIKRLFRKLDGTIVLRSDNPDFPDEEVSVNVAEEHIAIIGRVRDKSGTGGL